MTLLAGNALAQVKTTGGLVGGNGLGRRKDPDLQRHSLCRSARGRPAMAAASARGAMDGRARRVQTRAGVHARQDVRGHLVFGDERRLPHAQHLRASGARRPQAAGHGLDSRRRVPGRRRRRTPSRRPGVRPQGRRARDDQLPAGRLRLPRASRSDEGVGAPRVWQLRHARPGRRAAVGARRTSRRSAAIRATSRSSASPPGRSR